MSADPITAWLAEFGRAVPLRGRRRRRAVAELEAHLMDAADAARAAGDHDPAGRAVARVGAPALVAGAFRRPGPATARLALALWLPAAVAATVCLGTVYAVGQTTLRTGADDPQIQLAQDAAARLAAGATAQEVAAGPQVDLASGLGVNVTVLDAAGTVLSSTARLDGGLPRPPSGALRAAVSGGQNVITWQPRDGVRQAAVIVPFVAAAGSGAGSGTVVVARSLRLVEQREDTLLELTALGWVLALLAAAATALQVARRWPGARPPDLPPSALATA